MAGFEIRKAESENSRIEIQCPTGRISVTGTNKLVSRTFRALLDHSLFFQELIEKEFERLDDKQIAEKMRSAGLSERSIQSVIEENTGE